MIAIWNRKEVFFGTSAQNFNKIRDRLEANQIPYTYRLKYRGDGRRSRWGSIGERTEYIYQYYIYVHKGHYEQARFVLNQ